MKKKAILAFVMLVAFCGCDTLLPPEPHDAGIEVLVCQVTPSGDVACAPGDTTQGPPCENEHLPVLEGHNEGGELRTLDEKMALLPAAHVEICHDLIDAMVAGHEEHREPLEALRVIPESKKEIVDLVNYFQIGLWQMKRFVAASCETCCDRRDKLEARLAAMGADLQAEDHAHRGTRGGEEVNRSVSGSRTLFPTIAA